MDFLYLNLKLNNNLFVEAEKIILIQVSLKQLVKKDNSLTKRIHTWLFGKPNFDNRYELNDENLKNIDFINQALNDILSEIPTEKTCV